MRAIDLVSRRRWLFLFSGLLVVASLVLLAIPPALKPGIEFTSGTTALYRFESRVAQEDLRQAYSDLGHSEARVQSTGSNEYLIRTSELEVPDIALISVAPDPAGDDSTAEDLPSVLLGAEDADGEQSIHVLQVEQDGACFALGDPLESFPAGTTATVVDELPTCVEEDEGAGVILRVQVGGADGPTGYVLAEDTRAASDGDDVEGSAPEIGAVELGERGVIEAALEEQFGAFEVLEFASVSSVISQTAARNAAIAVVVASLFIMGYIVFAFSSVPRPFRYAVCAMVALAHDVIIVLGAFSLFGKLFDIEINLMFVTGLLTVIGFSVHDTIVVFDRVRENVRLAPDAPLGENVNAALVQTLARSLNTSVTLLFTVLALLLLGGVTIRPFLLVLLVGVMAGTYSSIAIAAQLLVSWEEGDLRRLRFWRRGGSESEESAVGIG